MASEKKPSIYYDRGTIGSSKELDEYGVWVKSEPQDLSPEGARADPEGPREAPLPEDSTSRIPSESGPPEHPTQFPPEDFSIEEDLSLKDFAEDSTEMLPEFDDVHPAEDNREFTEVSIEDFLGDTSAAGSGNGPEPAVPAEFASETEGRGSPQELSTQFLMKIADELASIRNELAALKNEFSAAHPGDDFGKDHDTSPPDESQNYGFFDEKEGEKTALTGDELDNILNTADFIEDDAGTAVLEDIVTDIPGDIAPDIDGIEEAGEKISPEEEKGDLSPAPQLGPEDEEAPLADIKLSPESETEDIVLDDLSLDDIDFDENSFDFSGVAIDEPDLDAETQESPGGEDPEETPVSVDLDLEEDADGLNADTGGIADDTAVNAEEEIEFSIPDFAVETADIEPAAPGSPVEEESFAQVIPEGFVVEGEDTPVLDDDGLETEFPAFEEQDDGVEAVLDSGLDVVLDDGIETGLEAVDESPVTGEPVTEEIAAGIPDEVPPEPADKANESQSLPPEAEDIPLELADEADESQSLPPEAEDIPDPFKQEVKTVLSYMDQLLESLPEEKIEEFAKSEYFDTYKKLFKELGIV